MSEKRTSVAILESVYEKVKAKAEGKGETIQNFVNELLLMNVERDKFLTGYAPYLSLDYVSERCLFLHDAKLDKVIPVNIKYLDNESYDGRIKVNCETDDSDNCVHVRFALALPELIRLNINKSMKKP